MDLAAKIEDKSTINYMLSYLKPEVIDDSGKFFEFADALRSVIKGDYSFCSMLKDLKSAPRQVDIDAVKMLTDTYNPLGKDVSSYYLTNIIENLNEDNFPVLAKLLEKFNGKNDILIENKLVPANENYIDWYDLREILQTVQTREDAEIISLMIDRGFVGGYSNYSHNISLSSSRVTDILENAKKFPNITKWVKTTDIDEAYKLLTDGYNPKIEEFLPKMSDEQRNFFNELLRIKTPQGHTLCHLGLFDDRTFKQFQNISPDKYKFALQLGPKMYDANLLLEVASELPVDGIAKFNDFIDKGVSPTEVSYLPDIIKAEKTFGNKEAYDKLVALITSDENADFSVEVIRNILQNPYNEKSFNYIMDNIENSDYIEPAAMVKYISLDPNNVDNLAYLKTSSNYIATPEAVSYIMRNMDKPKMVVFNEIVNELRTHNDQLGYDMEFIGNMLELDFDPDATQYFQKLYRWYDENGNHIIPASSLHGLAENTELAAKVLDETPSDVAKLDLTNYKVSDAAVKDLAEKMPDEFKVLLYNENGEFTAKEYTALLNKLNENEYLRDALADFEQTGKIDLYVFQNKELALGLIDNNPQLLGIIKKSPEALQNNPGSIKQNLSMVNELIDDQMGRYVEFVKNNPGLLPPTADLDNFLKEVDKVLRSENETAKMFTLISLYGAKNVKSAIAKMNPKNFDGGLGHLIQYADSDFAPLFGKIFAMKDVGEAEFDLIMRVADFTDIKTNQHYYREENSVKLLEQDFGEILEKIVANGKFDKQAFFEDVYQGLLAANVTGFDPMTPQQLKIIADSDFLSNPNIKPQEWAEFTNYKPEVRNVIASLLKYSSFDNVKKILELSDDNANALAGMSFSDKMKMLDIVDSLKKEDIDALENAGYNINSAIMKVVKALNIEKKFIQTDTVKQQAFLKNVIANNNPRAEALLKNTDFTTEEFAQGIPLKYPRAKFVADMKQVLDGLNPAEQTNVLKYFDIYKTDMGFEGMPVIPKNSDMKLSPSEKAAADKLAGFIEEFTLKNETTVKDPELKSLLDALVQGMPEFTTVVSKAQHGTHAYTVDVHTLKVLQYAMNDPAYAKLPDRDKTMLKLTALVHDFGKKEGVVDEGHAVLSSEYVDGILAKFNMPESLKYRVIELVNNHHWFAAFNKGEMTTETMATLCRNPEDFEVSKILAKADLLGVSDNFYLDITHTSTREEFDSFTADKFSYIDKKLKELRKKANFVFDTPLMQNGRGFPLVKAKVGGEETELRVLNLTDNNVTDLTKYGFAPGTTKENARFTVHMTPNEIEDADGGSSPMNIFNILSANPTHHSVQSTSLISFNNNRTYGNRKFGFILDVDQSNISTADYQNVGSGTNKTLEDFTQRLFAGYDNRSWMKSEFQAALKRKKIEMDDEVYSTLAKFLYSKKYGTQLYCEYVNENVPVNEITGKTGFTKELYAEYISPKTTAERKAEIFDLCVASKTFVIKKDGTIGVEYDSKTGGKVPDDGEFRIKAKDLRAALESSRDELFQGVQHSEIVSMTPRVNGLIARVSRIEDCPQTFLQFAKEHDLPIILIGFKNPMGSKK